MIQARVAVDRNNRQQCHLGRQPFTAVPFTATGGAKVLGKFPVPGRPTIWIKVGQGPTALAVGGGGGLFGHFYSHLSFLSSFTLSLGDGPI